MTRMRASNGKLKAIAIELFLLFFGIVAAVTALVLAKQLMAEGSLPVIAWLVLIVSALLFIALFLRVLRTVEPERERYLQLVADSDLGCSPRDFIDSWTDLAEQFVVRAKKEGHTISLSQDSFPEVSRLLRKVGTKLRDDPELLGLAAAYVGGVFARELEGRWSVWKRGKYRDAIVILGHGRTRHEISPGLLVLRIAEEPDVTLEGTLAHETHELS